MPQKQILFEGVTHTFPDDFTDAEIQQALEGLPKNQFADVQSGSSSAAAPSSFMDIVKKNAEFATSSMKSAVEPYANAAVGAAKGAGSTAFNMSQFLQGMNSPRKLTPEGYRTQPVTPATKPEFLKPQGAAQKVGFGAEQIGEFMIPGMAGKRATTMLGKAAQAAAGTGLVTAAQGGDSNAVLASAATAGVIPLVVPAISAAVRETGKKIVSVALSPKHADKLNGFKITNVFKHGVGGSPADTVKKSGDKIVSLGKELKTELAKTPNAQVDMLKLINDTEKDLVSKAASRFGRDTGTEAAIKEFKDNLLKMSATGSVDLADAQAMKRSLGLIGEWAKGMATPEAKGKVLVATNLYSKVREAIENTALNGGRVKEINKALSELIPIEQVAAKSLSASERRAVLGLIDAMAVGGTLYQVKEGQNPNAFWLAVLTRMGRSGRVGNALATGAASRATGATMGPLLGGATGLMTSRDR